MTYWHAARPGDPLEAIDTPALVLDLGAFERNLDRMSTALEGSAVRLRPHAKSHKCPEIALRQIALGAVGICCQKLSEAWVFADAGVSDILITNEVVGASKVARLMQLAARARIGVLADDAAQVDALAAAVRAAGVALDVYVEVDVGAGRCGVAPGAPAAALAQRIAASGALRFAGLHCYHGAAQHLRRPQDRKQAIADAARLARHAREAVAACGINVEIVTGAGTGTLIHERDSGIYNEVQPGSYIFMDRDYADNVRGLDEPPFEPALFVKTTVMSRPTAGRAIVDAGLKASSLDSGMPAVWQRKDLRYVKASDEHGVLECLHADTPSVGDPLLLLPGHCDPTVNLYDTLVCIRGDRVEALWPVAARGAVL
jgi:D-threonine aldolase